MMFRWLRWQIAKRRLSYSEIEGDPPCHIQISFELNKRKVEDFPPTMDGYDKLASFWEELSAWRRLDYSSFLAATEVYFGIPINRVLDLACGTGLLTRHLGKNAEF